MNTNTHPKLPLCAIGTSPPNFTKPRRPIRDISRVVPAPYKLSIPTPYCSEFECSWICDPRQKSWPEGAQMAELCAAYCNDNRYVSLVFPSFLLCFVFGMGIWTNQP